MPIANANRPAVSMVRAMLLVVTIVTACAAPAGAAKRARIDAGSLTCCEYEIVNRRGGRLGTLEAWIATYPGGERFLNETVESLRAQGIEPLVLNDDRKTYEKWNYAIKHCRSDYLALPHHDDIYLPGWSKELTAYLDAHPDVVAVFCLDYLIDEDGKRIGQTYPAWDEKDRSVSSVSKDMK